jgi:thiamine-phosphate pyrophosphorylase
VTTSSLYAIIDPDVCGEPVTLAQRALDAGCALLQLRAKRLDDRALVTLAMELRNACKARGARFVVNDRADIAKLVGADGLHLGQNDLPVVDARRVVGQMQIGVSTHDLDQARQAELDGADLIAFGPVFSTQTKENPDPIVGLRALAEVCRIVTRPGVAIGGITPENAKEALDAGAAYVAVISALPRFVAD